MAQPVLPYQVPYPVQPGQVPCPKCGCLHSKPVTFTWWGGVLGPKLLNHVKCLGCNSAFNGKTGRSNTVGVTIYIVVTSLIGFALLAMWILARH